MIQGSAKSVWQVQDNVGLLQCANLEAQVDLLRPSRGLQQIVFQSQRLDGCIPLQLSLHPPAADGTEALADFYVRGHDLVARYAEKAPRTIEPTLYWRSLDLTTPLAGIELLASMQTSLLDSDPTLVSVSQCDGEAFWLTRTDNDVRVSPLENDSAADSDWVSPAGERGFFLSRLHGCEVSYAEMVLPADFQGAHIARTSGSPRLTYELFPESLEKGVIRRGRIRSLFLPREHDAQAAWDVYENLCADKPPLTT